MHRTIVLWRTAHLRPAHRHNGCNRDRGSIRCRTKRSCHWWSSEFRLGSPSWRGCCTDVWYRCGDGAAIGWVACL